MVFSHRAGWRALDFHVGAASVMLGGVMVSAGVFAAMERGLL